MNISEKKFEDLCQEDFTEEEFQRLVDFIKFLSDMDKKYNPAKYGELAAKEIVIDM